MDDGALGVADALGGRTYERGDAANRLVNSSRMRAYLCASKRRPSLSATGKRISMRSMERAAAFKATAAGRRNSTPKSRRRLRIGTRFASCNLRQSGDPVIEPCATCKGL